MNRIDPATKYSDKVSQEHRDAMEALVMARLMLAVHRQNYTKLIDAERVAHNIGHIINPTLYMDMIHSDSFAKQMKLVNAAETFLKAVDDVLGPLNLPSLAVEMPNGVVDD